MKVKMLNDGLSHGMGASISQPQLIDVIVDHINTFVACGK